MKAFDYYWRWVLDIEDFNYPEDMIKILEYLDSKGNINVSPFTIQNLYYEYSAQHAASWLIVDDERLKDFADWLSEYEL